MHTLQQLSLSMLWIKLIIKIEVQYYCDIWSNSKSYYKHYILSSTPFMQQLVDKGLCCIPSSPPVVLRSLYLHLPEPGSNKYDSWPVHPNRRTYYSFQTQTNPQTRHQPGRVACCTLRLDLQGLHSSFHRELAPDLNKFSFFS